MLLPYLTSVSSRVRASRSAVVLVAAHVALAATIHAQVTTSPRGDGNARIERWPDGVTISIGGGNRAVIGVTLAPSSVADTAGVRIESVDANGPAAAAGIKAGDVITSINGTSLRVSRTDADDPSLAGVSQRRLQRLMGKLEPGDEVDLRVATGGQQRAAKVKTVSAAALDGRTERRVSSRATNDKRAAVGVAVGLTGSVRDSLGLFVSSVTSNGPAEKAGIVEGERIAAVNGVDVRVPREDVDDAVAARARVDRFAREVQKVAIGGTVTLRVYSGGRFRDVSVTTVNASDLPFDGFRVMGDELSGLLPRVMSLPGRMFVDSMMTFPRVRSGPGSSRVFEFDGRNGMIRIDGDSVSRMGEDIRRAIERMRGQVRSMSDTVRLRDGVRYRIRTEGYSVTPPVRRRAILSRA